MHKTVNFENAWKNSIEQFRNHVRRFILQSWNFLSFQIEWKRIVMKLTINKIYLLDSKSFHEIIVSCFSVQMEKYAHICNVILGIIKAHYNIVKTRPSNVKYGNINAIAMGPTHTWPIQRCHHCKLIIHLTLPTLCICEKLE